MLISGVGLCGVAIIIIVSQDLLVLRRSLQLLAQCERCSCSESALAVLVAGIINTQSSAIESFHKEAVLGRKLWTQSGTAQTVTLGNTCICTFRTGNNTTVRPI